MVVDPLENPKKDMASLTSIKHILFPTPPPPSLYWTTSDDKERQGKESAESLCTMGLGTAMRGAIEMDTIGFSNNICSLFLT